MGYLASNLPCRFSFFFHESPVYLLSLCPGTLLYRCNHGLSLDTLRSDSPKDIVLIAKFNSWISNTQPFDSCLPIVSLLNESLAYHLEESTPTTATTVHSSAGPSMTPLQPQKTTPTDTL